MQMKELRTKGRDELVKQLASLREQLRNLQFRIHSKEVKNSHQMKEVRQDIARILTILNEKV